MGQQWRNVSTSVPNKSPADKAAHHAMAEIIGLTTGVSSETRGTVLGR